MTSYGNLINSFPAELLPSKKAESLSLLNGAALPTILSSFFRVISKTIRQGGGGERGEMVDAADRRKEKRNERSKRSSRGRRVVGVEAVGSLNGGIIK